MKEKYRRYFFQFFIFLVFSSGVRAGLNDDMNQFFNKLGFEQNTTSPNVWQGQAAGYATGGQCMPDHRQ